MFIAIQIVYITKYMCWMKTDEKYIDIFLCEYISMIYQSNINNIVKK